MIGEKCSYSLRFQLRVYRNSHVPFFVRHATTSSRIGVEIELRSLAEAASLTNNSSRVQVRQLSSDGQSTAYRDCLPADDPSLSATYSLSALGDLGNTEMAYHYQ